MTLEEMIKIYRECSPEIAEFDYAPYLVPDACSRCKLSAMVNKEEEMTLCEVLSDIKHIGKGL